MTERIYQKITINKDSPQKGFDIIGAPVVATTRYNLDGNMLTNFPGGPASRLRVGRQETEEGAKLEEVMIKTAVDKHYAGKAAPDDLVVAVTGIESHEPRGGYHGHGTISFFQGVQLLRPTTGGVQLVQTPGYGGELVAVRYGLGDEGNLTTKATNGFVEALDFKLHEVLPVNLASSYGVRGNEWELVSPDGQGLTGTGRSWFGTKIRNVAREHTETEENPDKSDDALALRVKPDKRVVFVPGSVVVTGDSKVIYTATLFLREGNLEAGEK